MIQLSVVIPAFMEEENIAQAVSRNAAACREAGLDFEILVVDDGSRDGTPRILAELTTGPNLLRVVTHPRNLGFGAAVRTGLRSATGEFVIVAPADCPHGRATLERFVASAHDADLVLGYREDRPGYNPIMLFNTWLYHALLRLCCGLDYRDVNWIHLYRRAAFAEVEIEFGGIVMGAEIVLKARSRGMRILEIPCPMEARTRGIASAAKPRVMVRTGSDLLRLLWRARSYRRWSAERANPPVHSAAS